jgi:ribonuclease VapC
MFLDASAIIAIIAMEEDEPELSAKLDKASRRLVSPLSIYESTLGLARIARGNLPGARRSVADFADSTGAIIIEIDRIIAEGALDAFARFGRGRHRAALNLGDCFSYACARVHRVPLLCKGDDFIHTDIRLA